MKTTLKFSWFVLAMLVIVQAAEAQVVRVTAATVNIRTEPTTASGVVTTVTKGSKLEVVETYGTWYMVDVLATGDVGYIHRALVEVVEQAGTRAQPPTGRTAAPPAAQPTAAPPAPHTTPPAESYARTQSMEQPPDDGIDFTLWGGLLDAGGTNLSGGAALGFFVGGPAAEIEIGGEYTRMGSGSATESSGFGSSVTASASSYMVTVNGSFNYNIRIPQSRVVPYGSAGMVWARQSGSASVSGFGFEESLSVSGSETAFQFGGGVKFPIGEGPALRGDVRFNLFEGFTATRLFVGITF